MATDPTETRNFKNTADFIVVTEKLKKIRGQNARRRTMSQPDVYTVPTLKPSEVLFIPASKMRGKAASCYACERYNHNRSCMLFGPNIPIRKFFYPPKPVPADSKQLEFWPCCGEFTPGEPNYGPEEFAKTLDDPSETGLIWINAPEVGLDYSGATCGGNPNSDECDQYVTEEPDARKTKTGWCRVLQRDVENEAVCCGWRDDDTIYYETGNSILRELDGTD